MLFEVELLCLVALFVGKTFATNIIFILADDLGFGDLGFSPFSSEEFKGIKTPHLQRLAASGLTLTNFHTASPVCSPSRVSILTGLFPWRVGVDFIYSQDKKLDGSEELDHEQLPLLANIPMTLRDQGFYTAHVGKWHLGMRRFDCTRSQYVFCDPLLHKCRGHHSSRHGSETTGKLLNSRHQPVWIF